MFRRLVRNMTVDYHITKFDSEIIQHNIFGYRTHKVELNVHWVSCGFYTISYPKFEYKPFPEAKNSKAEYVWTVDGMNIPVDPAWIDKILELYPTVEKLMDRTKTFSSFFFQEFYTDRGMFDMGHDAQFSVYKSQVDDWIVIHNHPAFRGTPSKNVEEWTIKFESLKALNDKLKDPKTEQPMYSGCKMEII